MHSMFFFLFISFFSWVLFILFPSTFLVCSVWVVSLFLPCLCYLGLIPGCLYFVVFIFCFLFLCLNFWFSVDFIYFFFFLLIELILRFLLLLFLLFPGFDLMTWDLYFMILVEVFTNCILAENTYFMSHVEWTEHKITASKPANKYFQHHPFIHQAKVL